MATIRQDHLIASFTACVTLLVYGAGHAAAQDAHDNISPNRLCILTLGQASPHTMIMVPGYSYVGSPSFSKDGEWIAFDAYKQDSEVGDCWVVRRDGSDLKVLAKGGTTPRWSPDGKRILFMREIKSNPPAKLGVYVINRDGSGESWLCEGRWPDWSADGKRIVYSKGGRGERGGTRPLSRVYIARNDGTNEELVGDGDGPSWSPDGWRIACCQSDPAIAAPFIRVIDLHDGSQSILGYGWWRANWSPDSRELVTNSMIGAEQVGMIRLAADSPHKRVERLLPEGSKGLSPCFSPDGKQIVFVTEQAEEEGARQ